MDNPTMAQILNELVYLLISLVGEGLSGGFAVGLVAIVCLVLVLLDKGIFSWVGAILLTLLCLNHMMTVDEELGIGEAISELLIIGGIGVATIQNLIAIVMGHYWKIKRNLITGGVAILLGWIIGNLV